MKNIEDTIHDGHMDDVLIDMSHRLPLARPHRFSQDSAFSSIVTEIHMPILFQLGFFSVRYHSTHIG